MPLTIGLITGEYPPMEGGVGAFTRELARAMSAHGHTIHVITGRGAVPASVSRTWRDLREPVDAGFARLHPRINRWRYRSLATIADIALRYDLDVLNVQYQAAAFNMRSPAINLLPWRMKGVLKTVVTFHDLKVPYLFPKAGPIREAMIRFMARQAHGVIATNRGDFQALEVLLPRASNLAKIPIGSNIPANPVRPSGSNAIRSGLGLDEGDRLLGYFGFLNPSKGADTLLTALSELESHFHLLFIGGQHGSSDPANNQLFSQTVGQMIASLGLEGRVHWTRFMSEEAVSDHLHAVDMMVMPYRDGASLRRGTMMAALAHGRPVVTTEPSSPTPELVHGHNVHFVPPANARLLAEAIRLLSRDTDYRARLAQGAASTSSLFSWERIADDTIELYKVLLHDGERENS
jgi:glycosyltransferase involved in cell wall biosynthesis